MVRIRILVSMPNIHIIPENVYSQLPKLYQGHTFIYDFLSYPSNRLSLLNIIQHKEPLSEIRVRVKATKYDFIVPTDDSPLSLWDDRATF